MASIYKTRSGWRVQIRRKGYATQSEMFKTKAEAESWARRVEHEMDGSRFVAPSKEPLRKLLERYSEEVSPTHKGARWEQTRIRSFFKTMPFVDKAVGEVTRLDVQAWRDARLKSVSGSSVNRELNVLSAVFSYAMKEWGVTLLGNPVHEIRRPKSSKPRHQRIPPTLLPGLWAFFEGDGVSPPRTGVGAAWDSVPWLTALAMETAMRLGELCTLQWIDVHLDKRYVQLHDTKNGESRTVPLTTEAVRLLTALQSGRGDDPRVFPVNKESVGVYFRRAVRALGYEDIHFHDTRHEGTSRLAQKLSNVLELASVTGHKDLRCLKIYFNPTPEELAKKLD